MPTSGTTVEQQNGVLELGELEYHKKWQITNYFPNSILGPNISKIDANGPFCPFFLAWVGIPSYHQETAQLSPIEKGKVVSWSAHTGNNFMGQKFPIVIDITMTIDLPLSMYQRIILDGLLLVRGKYLHCIGIVGMYHASHALATQAIVRCNMHLNE